MTAAEIIRMRLQNQQLLKSEYSKPEDVVRWMTAVQAQDYAGAKWALGCRMQLSKDSDVDAALDEGRILRTHVLRPTWHFVLPDDIRWMIELTEPRISAFSAKYMRDLGLDKKVFTKTNKIIVHALEKEGYLTKQELGDILKASRVDTADLRLTYILFRAELDCLVCSGPRKGKQMTYSLLDERAPAARKLKKEEALYELAIRYFRSRGPATVKDFAWWSGLSAGDARAAGELVNKELNSIDFLGETLFFSPESYLPARLGNISHLFSAWDEYTVAYKDRSLVVDPAFEKESGNGIFNSNIAIKGKVIGSWRREIKKESVHINLNYFDTPSHTVVSSVQKVAAIYARFIDKEPTVKIVKSKSVRK